MLKIIFDNTLLFIVLINPVSKILILSSFGKESNQKELQQLALKSTATGLGILVLFAYAGTFILRSLFHIQIFSLQIAAGAVLFLIGLRALQKGEFFEIDFHKRLSDIAVAPLASPMLAGPATITAAISQSALFGANSISLSILLALLINLLIMVATIKASSFLKRWRLMGSLVRITGLFIASIGVNIGLLGIKSFLKWILIRG